MRRLLLLGGAATLYLAWTLGVPLLRGVRSGDFMRHAEVVTWTSLGVLGAFVLLGWATRRIKAR